MKNTRTKPTKETRQPLGVAAYEQICRKIITLVYKPGAILDEKQLMADLEFGRTPIREAILRLAGEGWIETQPNRGAMVPPITIQGTKAVFEAMKILELGVANLAVNQNIDEQLTAMRSAGEQVKESIENGDILRLVDANHVFHLAYADCAKNEFLTRACLEVRNQAKRLAYLSYANDIGMNRSLQGHYEAVVNEHEAMITCLFDKNEVRLKEIILQHINAFQSRILAYMSS
ncbi:MAG: GntR family transcriptional regulator [Proteobacteria bacterium]|nr:GntR family transcriptional regulator [Pseudomonadota bacterium]